MTYRWPHKLADCFQCERKLKRLPAGDWAHVYTDPLTGKHDMRKQRAAMRRIDVEDHDPDPKEETCGYGHYIKA